jgi:hypothetical protein
VSQRATAASPKCPQGTKAVPPFSAMERCSFPSFSRSNAGGAAPLICEIVQQRSIEACKDKFYGTLKSTGQGESNRGTQGTIRERKWR